MNKDQFIATVINGLERILFEGQYGLLQNFAIFELYPRYYIQFLAARGDYKVKCEVVSNWYLPTDEYIDEFQIEQLSQLGWNIAVGEDNHSIELPCESIENRRDLAELFYKTAQIYKAEEIANVEVHIG